MANINAGGRDFPLRVDGPTMPGSQPLSGSYQNHTFDALVCLVTADSLLDPWTTTQDMGTMSAASIYRRHVSRVAHHL